MKTCLCDKPDHDMCWDGFFGKFDATCSCCKNTLEAIQIEGDTNEL